MSLSKFYQEINNYMIFPREISYNYLPKKTAREKKEMKKTDDRFYHFLRNFRTEKCHFLRNFQRKECSFSYDNKKKNDL